MDFNQIISNLKNKVYHPIYFLMGEETYYIDVVSDYIEKNVLDDSEKEFNQTVLYGRDTDILAVIGAAKRFPMMSNYQVVIVKEAQDLKDFIPKEKTKEKKDEEKKSPFLTYLENPQKSTILVFCYRKNFDKRTSLSKQIDKKAVLFESKKIYDNQVAPWIESYLKKKNYSINPKAAAMLAEFLGNDLGKVVNELDKLMILIPPNSEITPEHVQKNIGISKDFNVFELQAAIGKKDFLKANQIVKYFGANEKENPLVMTISSLYGFFSKILLYHSLKDKSRNNAAASLGVSPYFVGDYERAAKNYTSSKIKFIVNYLREGDLKSKGVDDTGTDHGELLKELVFKIMH